MQMKALANSVHSQKNFFFPDRIPLRLKEGRPSSDSEESVIASYIGTAVFMPHVGKL